MRRRRLVIVLLLAAVSGGAAAAAAPAQDLSGPLVPAAAPGPFDALPPTLVAPRASMPRARIAGLRAGAPLAPPTDVTEPRQQTDRSRHFAVAGDPIAVRLRGRRTRGVRVRLLRVTRAGTPMREVADRRLRPRPRARRPTTLRVPALRGAHHELRLTEGRRIRRAYLYTPAGGAARAVLGRGAYEPGDELTGEVIITGDAPLSGGVCGAVEELRDGAWRPPRTADPAACILLLAGFGPGERHPLGVGTLPEDLPAGRYRYVRRFTAVLTGEDVEATAEFSVVR